MENAIKKMTPVDVDLQPNLDCIYSGICLKNGHDVFVFICFNEDIMEYDGVAIIRSQEIEQYRYWEENEIAEIKNNNYMDFVNALQLENLNTFYDCLNLLQQKALIAVYTKEDSESYYVGKIEILEKEHIILKLISNESKWLNSINIIIDDITYIGFDSSYEKQLMDKIK